jgi:hypothetical protein
MRLLRREVSAEVDCSRWRRAGFTLIGPNAVFIRVTAASLVPRHAISGQAAPFSVGDPGYAAD